MARLLVAGVNGWHAASLIFGRGPTRVVEEVQVGEVEEPIQP